MHIETFRGKDNGRTATIEWNEPMAHYELSFHNGALTVMPTEDIDPFDFPGATIQHQRTAALEYARDAAKDFTHGSLTNVERVLRLMEHSRHGALTQAFVNEAIVKYATMVCNADDEALGGPHAFIAPAAWRGVANEALQIFDAVVEA